MHFRFGVVCNVEEHLVQTAESHLQARATAQPIIHRLYIADISTQRDLLCAGWQRDNAMQLLMTRIRGWVARRGSLGVQAQPFWSADSVATELYHLLGTGFARERCSHWLLKHACMCACSNTDYKPPSQLCSTPHI